MKIRENIDEILEALETANQRCTYNALTAYLGITFPQLITALGPRRSRASWIVNPHTLKPTKYLAHQEHNQLYSNIHVITDSGGLRTFLLSPSAQEIVPKKALNPQVISYGVDGCRGGWLFAKLDGTSLSFGIVNTIDDLIAKVDENSRVFIDIPIGLRDGSPDGRLCDVQARKVLTPGRSSSVFNAPIRAILDFPTHRSASDLSKKLIGKGISQQTFNIMPKIAEVDRLMATHSLAKSIIREVHPEVCFYGLASGRPMEHKKKSRAGFHERLALIEKFLPAAEESISKALADYPRSRVAEDDVLDAVVAAITAANPTMWATIPINPERDALGLPMEMVYLRSQEFDR